MSRPKKIKNNVESTKLAETLAQPIVKPVLQTNDSINNLNNILESTAIDDLYASAEKDGTTIVAKSSIKNTNNVIEPKSEKLKKVPNDVVITGTGSNNEANQATQSSTVKSNLSDKSDSDSPNVISMEDLVSRNFGIYDYESDRLIQDVFYANQVTGTLLVLLKNEEGRPVVVVENSIEQPVLVLKNRKVYFKKNIKI